MTRSYCDEALEAAGIKPTEPKAHLNESLIATLLKLDELAYQQKKKGVAQELGIPVAALDKIVRQRRAQADGKQAELPHWKVEPWDSVVLGAALLDDIVGTFEHYIVLPRCAADALALWVLHAWTMNAGDTSPFLVLVSPTKRCGKTSVLIILLYLTPRSELASNISASAVFRYVEDVSPTLLIDEADSFIKDNEEMRGILNSGHTKAAAHVIRNVEVNGEHKARRFSTWAPKAIATIQSLADTLEDRAVIVQLQRKPRTAEVARLRKRDSSEFAIVRRQAARWAADNFDNLTDPDPAIPQALNDRAADNWRPLPIADMAGGAWPQRAREAACVLSGEGHDSAENVNLLADIRDAFGDAEVMRSADLVAELVSDPERPWVEWRHGKPLTQKQLGGLLKAFQIKSVVVHPPGVAPKRGYTRGQFESLWETYFDGQNAATSEIGFPKCSSVQVPLPQAQEGAFRSVRDDLSNTSKTSLSSYSPNESNTSTLRKPESGTKGHLTTNPAPSGGVSKPATDSESSVTPAPKTTNGGRQAEPDQDPDRARATVVTPKSLWDDLDIPPDLRRTQERTDNATPRERLGPPAISSGPDDDIADFLN